MGTPHGPASQVLNFKFVCVFHDNTGFEPDLSLKLRLGLLESTETTVQLSVTAEFNCKRSTIVQTARKEMKCSGDSEI